MLDVLSQAFDEQRAFPSHSFELACARNDIDHRLTKPGRPWTNRQVERMDGAIKDATVKRFHYAAHDQLRERLNDFMAAFYVARCLKPCAASHHTRRSTNHGQASHIGSVIIGARKFRNQTASLRPPRLKWKQRPPDVCSPPLAKS